MHVREASRVFDLCFFCAGRLSDPTRPADREQVELPPDRAIEIRSPGQTVGELTHKLRSAIRRVGRLGWLIDDSRRKVHVLRPGLERRVLGPGDVLVGDDVLPRFAREVE